MYPDWSLALSSHSLFLHLPSSRLPLLPAAPTTPLSTMATRFDSWQPRPGTHSVGIGPALLAALDAYDGGPVQTPLTELYSFHCMPSPSNVLGCWD